MIPFRLRAAPELAGTGIRAKTDLRLPCGQRTSEVYLLMLAAFIGPEEPSYGSGRLTAIRDVDRFRLRLEYADGTVDECLPMNVATKQFAIVAGPQVLVAAADPARALQTLVLRDACKQGAFAVAAVSVRTKGEPACPEAREDARPLRLERVDPIAGAFEVDESRLLTEEQVTVSAPWLEATLTLTAIPVLESLIHRPTNWALLDRPCPLVEVTVDGQRLTNDDFSGLHRKQPRLPCRWYAFRTHIGHRKTGLRFGYGILMNGKSDLHLHYAVVNEGDGEHRVAITAPVLRRSGL